MCGGKVQPSMHTGQCCTCTQSTASESEKISDMMIPIAWYKKNVNTQHNALGFNTVSLQNPSDTNVHCTQQAAEMWVLLGLCSLGSIAQPPQTAYGLVMRPISTAVILWTRTTWGSGSMKTQSCRDITSSCKMHHVVCNQQAIIGPIFVWGQQ